MLWKDTTVTCFNKIITIFIYIQVPILLKGALHNYLKHSNKTSNYKAINGKLIKSYNNVLNVERMLRLKGLTLGL